MSRWAKCWMDWVMDRIPLNHYDYESTCGTNKTSLNKITSHRLCMFFHKTWRQMKYMPKRLQGASDKWQGKSPFWRLDKFVVSLIKTNKPAPESDAVSPAPQSDLGPPRPNIHQSRHTKTTLSGFPSSWKPLTAYFFQHFILNLLSFLRTELRLPFLDARSISRTVSCSLVIISCL